MEEEELKPMEMGKVRPGRNYSVSKDREVGTSTQEPLNFISWRVASLKRRNRG